MNKEDYFNDISLEKIQQNISHCFKILYLHNKIDKTFIISSKPDSQILCQTKSSSKSQFLASNEFISLKSIEPYATVLAGIDKKPDLNELIIFLNNCERNQSIRLIKNLISLELKKILNISFKTINKHMFNNFLTNLAIRWTKSNSKSVEFNLEETCNGKLVWTLKFSYDFYYNNPEKLIKSLIVIFITFY